MKLTTNIYFTLLIHFKYAMQLNSIKNFAICTLVFAHEGGAHVQPLLGGGGACTCGTIVALNVYLISFQFLLWQHLKRGL